MYILYDNVYTGMVVATVVCPLLSIHMLKGNPVLSPDVFHGLVSSQDLFGVRLLKPTLSLCLSARAGWSRGMILA